MMFLIFFFVINVVLLFFLSFCLFIIRTSELSFPSTYSPSCLQGIAHKYIKDTFCLPFKSFMKALPFGEVYKTLDIKMSESNLPFFNRHCFSGFSTLVFFLFWIYPLSYVLDLIPKYMGQISFISSVYTTVS